ncbi:M48 family metalloprotease [Mastigocoleus testarum]|uniref:Zn-dependent protease with chaperone function n=1 Tax=Mastigocoleus testarum BC008 TaxID=371196 RepID=A0A0V7ZUS9_9CYAN|nr:M48 family metalloprotease [Mastigocoleus testarum]KST67963.1 Zn-dependent protease with chaperone function [Mastigocoleus testarum BC008]KST68412.1 Zn-dependent protease with chaperone function [Mastigocoleus testarum BC008]
MPSHSELSLQSGLNALKQGDYQAAITILDGFISQSTNYSDVLQATIGLAVAYSRTGEVSTAISLCEDLRESDNQEVREWANLSLKKLRAKRSKEQLTSKNQAENIPEATGFIPFDNSASASNLLEENLSSSRLVTQDTSNVVEVPDSESSQDIFHTDKSLRQQHKINHQTRENKPEDNQTNNEQESTVAFEETKSSNELSVRGVTVHWRKAPKAKMWQPLPKPKLLLLRVVMVLTSVALFWTMRFLLVLLMESVNYLLNWLPFVESLQFLYYDPIYFLLAVVIVLAIASPWLLDILLSKFYPQQTLQKEQLNRYSPAANRLLIRYCQQRGWKLPPLFVLQESAPFAYSYGHLPRTARIVVTQGLLDQLENDEIAAVYGMELGHITYGDVGLTSLYLLVTLPIYGLYQIISGWGDWLPNKIGRSFLGVFANFFYCIWYVLTGTSLWFSQLRHYYSDRRAAEITGHPNAAIRALLKMAIGIAGDIEKQEKTSYLLESLNLLLPLGHKQSLSLGSTAPHIALESYLMWEYLNPYRWWFAANSSHPLTGHRIQRLCQIARQWRLETELSIEKQQPLQIRHQSFFIGMAPWWGIPLGLVLGFGIWLVWQIAYTVEVLNLKWIYDDWNFLLGCILIGFSIGTLVRINQFFPEIKPNSAQTNENFIDVLNNPASLPIDSNAVLLAGKLLGRCGTSNYLGQDLILQTNRGLLRLHHISWLGQGVNPQDFIGRQVIVRGWLRRGATPWVDIQILKTQSGKKINGLHPIWSMIFAFIFTALGAYIFLKG